MIWPNVGLLSVLNMHFMTTVKPVLSDHSKEDQNLGFQDP